VVIGVFKTLRFAIHMLQIGPTAIILISRAFTYFSSLPSV